MTAPEVNAFGANFPLDDLEHACARLGIRASDRVLEVGGAGNPFPRADVVCDLTFGSCAQRNGAPGVLRRDVSYVEAPAEALPFPDGAFDFVWCTQVLEHVRDPEAACRELARVARRGFVEVPSRFGELCNGNPTHRWIIDIEGGDGGGTLVFHPRTFVEHPLDNFFYGVLFEDARMRDACEHGLRNVFNHQVLFERGLGCRIVPAAGPVFDYDDPSQAARAHYSFARNTLARGAPADYAYPDALEAVRLAPRSASARLLLAVYQARLLRAADALETLRGVEGAGAASLRDLIGRLGAGQPVDLCSLPVPEPRLGQDADAARSAARPLVSVVIAGGDSEALLASAESALTQDYPEVEVVAAAPQPLNGGWERLRMGDRLRVLAQPAGTSLGACLNRAALATRGSLVAFCVNGERLMAHHVDRMVAQLLVSGGSAVHGDRLLLTGEGVVGPDIVPGNPASSAASLSTLVARRDFLEQVGAFDENAGAGAPLDHLLRVAGTGRLAHVREATVEGRGPLPSGAAALDELQSTRRLKALELMRDLMSAHVREQGLRAQITDLESRLRGGPGSRAAGGSP